MLRKLAPLILAAGLLEAAEPPPAYRFKVETLAEGLPQPMEMQRAPDGRIFFIEIAGKLRIYHPETKQITEAGTLVVTNDQENGLLGLALDPDFAHNHWLYLLHSPKDFSGQFISRFTIKGDELDPASRKDLLKYEEQRLQCCHHAGALRFGPDGCLYSSSGDNTNPFQSDGYSPHDDRPERFPWDAQKSAANTNDLRGKIIRIKPKPDGTYEIPPGNLFPPGTPQTRPEIFAMGFRNPWRFDIDQKTGIVYVGDVGPDAGKPGDNRGPVGYDTINQVRQPGYFGWPYSRGNEAYFAFNFEKKQTGPRFDPAHPLNASANNTGRKELPPVQAPLIWYPPGESNEFPLLGKGGRTACAGPVFHFKDSYQQTGGFPEIYDHCLLIYDWSRPFLLWARLDPTEKLAGLEPFPDCVRLGREPDDGTGRVSIRRPVDAFFGPEGALYLMDYGDTWGANRDSRLLKISYQWGNLAPIPKLTATPTAGPAPLQVRLSSEGSRDLEGDPISFEWRLQPGDKIISKNASAELALTAKGNFRAELRVTDSKGATATAQTPLVVGNTPPTVRFESPADGDFFTPGKPILYRVAVADAEDGTSAQQPDIIGFRTLVTAAWKTTDGHAAQAEPGFALMKQSDCFNCHMVEQPLVGPPLMAVAAKYRGQAGAENATVQRVMNGSTGVWGQVGMLPHPQHTEDEVHQMVQWIYSLQPGKDAPGLLRGIAGAAPIPKGEFSACTLEAVYTDAGAPPVGSLNGRATVTLRSRRLEAESADEIKGPQNMDNGGASGRHVLGSIGDKHYLRFANLNLSDSSAVKFRVASGGSGGKIELHAGSLTGPLLGEVEVKPTGDWGKYFELKAPLSNPPVGRTEVYVVFTNPGKGGLMNLDYLQFEPK